MYFSIAVILIYGISIALLVAASTLRRSHSDYELKSFMRSYSRLDVERRSREKQRVRAILKRLDRLTAPSTPQSGLVAIAAPHGAVTVSFRPPPGTPNVRPVNLPGLGKIRTATESARFDRRNLPTVSVVDVSAGDSCRGDDDGVLQDAVTTGTNALLHQYHQQQQQPAAVNTAPHHVSCLPHHRSERSLLVPKSNRDREFDALQPSTRRYSAV